MWNKTYTITKIKVKKFRIHSLENVWLNLKKKKKKVGLLTIWKTKSYQLSCLESEYLYPHQLAGTNILIQPQLKKKIYI